MTQTLIIGAGLCGLKLASLLTAAGKAVTVLEARRRPGGRVLSVAGPTLESHGYDLGPAWLWPHNGRLLAEVERLGLSLQRQHSHGRLVFQDGNGAVRRDLNFATMADALRIRGGMGALIDALAAELRPDAVRLGHRVKEIVAVGDRVEVKGADAEGAPFSLAANQVVLAMPPRVVAETIGFHPPLDTVRAGALANVPTWMAGQSKLVAVYRDAFWRKAGLSGDAVSRRGPLMEIHDASPPDPDLGEAALFGFVLPGAIRAAGSDADFKISALQQLETLFGPQAADPIRVHLKDWSTDRETSTASDLQGSGSHPIYRPLSPLGGTFDGRVLFSGTETAPEQGGFLEGALEAAEITAGGML